MSNPNPYSTGGGGGGIGTLPNPYGTGGGTPTPTPLPSAVFYTTVTIYKNNPGTEVHGDPTEATGTVVYSGQASVYPDRFPTEAESHLLPEGKQRWHVITPTDPGALVHYLVHWTDRVFTVVSRTVDVSGGLGREWWTYCVEVT